MIIVDCLKLTQSIFDHIIRAGQRFCCYSGGGGGGGDNGGGASGGGGNSGQDTTGMEW